MMKFLNIMHAFFSIGLLLSFIQSAFTETMQGHMRHSRNANKADGDPKKNQSSSQKDNTVSSSSNSKNGNPIKISIDKSMNFSQNKMTLTFYSLKKDANSNKVTIDLSNPGTQKIGSDGQREMSFSAGEIPVTKLNAGSFIETNGPPIKITADANYIAVKISIRGIEAMGYAKDDNKDSQIILHTYFDDFFQSLLPNVESNIQKAK